VASQDFRSTPNPLCCDFLLADGRDVSAELTRSAAGSTGPDVILCSTCDPMTDLARGVSWLEPFDVGLPNSLVAIVLRLVRGAAAAFLSMTWLAVAAGIVVGKLAPKLREVSRQDRPDLMLAQLIILLVLSLLLFLTLRGLVYWRVDQAGIHQYRLGLRNWSLPWTEIVSRQLGPYKATWIFLVWIAITGPPYQEIVLKDRRGRNRKINRLTTNGDRLDTLVRQIVNPNGEAELAQRYARAMQMAQVTHSQRKSDRAPLHFATKDAPVVRMRMHEPVLLQVCCNCLGPLAVRAPISMSPGLIGFLNDRFVRLQIPLCSACHAQARDSALASVSRIAGLIVLILVGTVFFALAGTEHRAWSSVGFATVAILFCLGALVLFWNEIHRLSPEKLVTVVRANAKQGWMDVRFGNPDYARLIADLNTSKAEKPSCELF
jgi:hypothetical protein